MAVHFFLQMYFGFRATDAIQQAVPVSGHTTDPVRMYMHDMGSVPLLTRSEEIDIAKRIEEGTRMVQRSLAGYPQAVSQLLSRYDECLKGSLRLGAIVTGFTDGGGGKLILTDEDREKNAELLRSMPAQQETGAESLQDDDDDEHLRREDLAVDVLDPLGPHFENCWHSLCF